MFLLTDALIIRTFLETMLVQNSFRNLEAPLTEKTIKKHMCQSEGHNNAHTQSGELLLCLADLNGFFFGGTNYLDWHSD